VRVWSPELRDRLGRELVFAVWEADSIALLPVGRRRQSGTAPEESWAFSIGVGTGVGVALGTLGGAAVPGARWQRVQIRAS